MKTKKMLIMFIALVFVLALLSGCGDAPKSENTSQPQAGNEGQSTASTPKAETPQKEAKVSIVPPAGWNTVQGSTVAVQYLKNGASFMVVEDNFNQGKTLEDVVKEAKAAIDGEFQDIKYEGETEAITVDGKDARKFFFTSKAYGIQMKYEYVYLFVGESLYQITFGDAANTFDSLAADYEKILSDIRFQ
ncbi:MAG: hypothetical protein KGZ93_00135 [Actinobacteria bacterium]|nr:hypothetical protein [Actinomycetota bacterium]